MQRTSVLIGLVLGFATGCSNSAPTAPVLEISPAAPTTLEELVATITTESTDSDRGDEVAYTWAWSVNGVLQRDITGSTVPAEATSRGDLWSVSVTASDGAAEAVGEASVTIVNTAPELVSLAMFSETPGALEDIVAIPTVTNLDEDLLIYTYEWKLDGEPVSVAGDRVSATFTEPGQVWEVSVSLTDGEFESGPLTATATVGNAAPIVKLLSVEPAEPSRLSTLQAIVSASDYDGHDVVLSYVWTVNGVEAGTSTSLSAAGLAVGDKVGFTVTATDGYTERSAGTTKPLVIVDLPPVVESVVVEPAEPKTTSVVEATAIVTDPEQDPFSVTYVWSVSGTEVLRGSQAVLQSDQFKKGDTIEVEVWGEDPYLAGVAVKGASLRVVNTPPTAPTVVFEPEIPREQTDLRCALGVESLDADGDVLTYSVRWELNGQAYTGTTGTTELANDTVPGARVTLGDTWDCFVVAGDGEATASEVGAGASEVRALDDGSEQDAAGVTCATINDAYPGLVDGVFWIDPNEGAKDDAFQTFCDMTIDGGGWTLLSWTGKSDQQPFGVPYPGLASCTELDCLRGSVGSREQVTVLTAGASAYVKAFASTPMASYEALDAYEFVGKYVYDDLSGITPEWSIGSCDVTNGVQGVFHNLKNADHLQGTAVYLAPAFRFQGYDYSLDSNTYLWNVGVPSGVCGGTGLEPGSWMGTWAPVQYGPTMSGAAGAHSVWLR